MRQIALPGVAGRDLASAIALQIDTLHPYGEDDVVYGWSRLENGSVLLGVLRRATLDRYAAIFAEAGIAVAVVYVFGVGHLHRPSRAGGAAACFGQRVCGYGGR